MSRATRIWTVVAGVFVILVGLAWWSFEDTHGSDKVEVGTVEAINATTWIALAEGVTVEFDVRQLGTDWVLLELPSETVLFRGASEAAALDHLESLDSVVYMGTKAELDAWTVENRNRDLTIPTTLIAIGTVGVLAGFFYRPQRSQIQDEGQVESLTGA